MIVGNFCDSEAEKIGRMSTAYFTGLRHVPYLVAKAGRQAGTSIYLSNAATDNYMQ